MSKSEYTKEDDHHGHVLKQKMTVEKTRKLFWWGKGRDRFTSKFNHEGIQWESRCLIFVIANHFFSGSFTVTRFVLLLTTDRPCNHRLAFDSMKQIGYSENNNCSYYTINAQMYLLYSSRVNGCMASGRAGIDSGEIRGRQITPRQRRDLMAG